MFPCIKKPKRLTTRVRRVILIVRFSCHLVFELGAARGGGASTPSIALGYAEVQFSLFVESVGRKSRTRIHFLFYCACMDRRYITRTWEWPTESYRAHQGHFLGQQEDVQPAKVACHHAGGWRSWASSSQANPWLPQASLDSRNHFYDWAMGYVFCCWGSVVGHVYQLWKPGMAMGNQPARDDLDIQSSFP